MWDVSHLLLETSIELFFSPIFFFFLVIFVPLMFVLSVLFLLAVISLPHAFYIVYLSLYRCFDAIFNAYKSSSSFLFGTYCQSTSSLGCKSLCIVIRFLVLWFICWSSTLVHFKNVPEYLTKGTAPVFISLMRFLLYSSVSSSFLVLLNCSFFMFQFISAYLMVSASNIPFLRAFWFCLDLEVLFLSS